MPPLAPDVRLCYNIPNEQQEGRIMADFTIIPWEERYHQDLIDLSVEWLEAYDLLEPADFILLNDPHGQALDVGGAIFFAQMDGAIVGTASMVPMDSGVFEMAKLCVTESARHRGIGEALVRRCIAFGREAGGTSIVLYSNRKLQAALRLYQKVGFQNVTHENSKYEVSDVKMVMDLL